MLGGRASSVSHAQSVLSRIIYFVLMSVSISNEVAALHSQSTVTAFGFDGRTGARQLNLNVHLFTVSVNRVRIMGDEI